MLLEVKHNAIGINNTMARHRLRLLLGNVMLVIALDSNGGGTPDEMIGTLSKEKV
jgi:hypothetical protein